MTASATLPKIRIDRYAGTLPFRSLVVHLRPRMTSGRPADVDLHELFDRMTQQELEAYARDGSLPTWFTATVGATGTDSQEA